MDAAAIFASGVTVGALVTHFISLIKMKNVINSLQNDLKRDINKSGSRRIVSVKPLCQDDELLSNIENHANKLVSNIPLMVLREVVIPPNESVILKFDLECTPPVNLGMVVIASGIIAGYTQNIPQKIIRAGTTTELVTTVTNHQSTSIVIRAHTSPFQLWAGDFGQFSVNLLN